VCAIDEFGDFMRKVTAKKSSSQETQIGKTLRMLWSSSFDIIGTPARAQDSSLDIVWTDTKGRGESKSAGQTKGIL